MELVRSRINYCGKFNGTANVVNSKIIIGLGSGRCGTKSLQHLFDSQPNSNFTHEALPMPWNRDPPGAQPEMFRRLFLRQEDYIGDVGYYWINYVEDMLSVEPDAKFICLERDRQEVIESMWDFTSGLNTHPTDDWFMMYPRYDTDPKSAVGLMWDDYRHLATQLATKHQDSFKIFGIESLNSTDGVNSILDFAGFPEDCEVLVGIKLNQRTVSLNKG